MTGGATGKAQPEVELIAYSKAEINPNVGFACMSPPWEWIDRLASHRSSARADARDRLRFCTGTKISQAARPDDMTKEVLPLTWRLWLRSVAAGAAAGVQLDRFSAFDGFGPSLPTSNLTG